MLRIPYIPEPVAEAHIPAKAAEIALQSHNWAADYPYAPVTTVKLWHNGSDLFLHFEVEENTVMAMAHEDNGPVYKDSCVEFFIAFSPEGYYNFETNCIGCMLMSHRKGRKVDVVYADPAILENIERQPSLGTVPFDCKESDGKWSLTLKIPATSFFRHDFKSLRGVEAKGNFYKCGDMLPRPHFMSWQPILTPNPDFHRPEFFAPILFE